MLGVGEERDMKSQFCERYPCIEFIRGVQKKGESMMPGEVLEGFTDNTKFELDF